MEALKGTSASKGISIGKVAVYKKETVSINESKIEDVKAEVERLENALNISVTQLNELYSHALNTVSEQQAAIFEVHAMMLEDYDYREFAKELILENSCSAEYAIKKTSDVFSERFASLDNEYMRARAADVKDVSNKVLKVLLNQGDGLNFSEQVILAAEDLLPSETVSIDKSKVLGILTKLGSKISHSAILARTMDIPAVVALDSEFEKLKDGDFVILDGASGKVFINPDEETLTKYQKEQGIYLKKKELLKELVGKKAITLDGVHIELNANIGHPSDVSICHENDADGIGLFRSEFIYMDSEDFPSENTQFEIYKQVLSEMNGKRVIIRTLDLGADKHAPYFDLGKEDNPALGYRALRICLKRPDIFTPQLKALLRASIFGKLAIMFPMVVSLEEVLEIKKCIADVKKQLDDENIPYSNDIEYGIMVETPSAAVITDILAKEVDFFSIGTNDLTQYTLACDRMNSSIEEIYNPRALAILRLIALTVKNAHKHGKWVGICGESAADLELTGLYLKMGVDELSVSPASLLELKNKIIHINTKDVDDSFLSFGI